MVSLDPVDALAEGVQIGLDRFAVGLSDDMINMSSTLSVNNSTEGQLLVDIATFTYNPFNDPTVVDTLVESALLYVLFLLAFIFVGGINVQISRMRPGREFLGMSISNGTTQSGYAISIFVLVIIGPLVPLFMWVILLCGDVVSNLIMSGILPNILLTPENVVLYFSMANIYLLMAASFVWRSIIIGISVAYCLIIVILIAISYTRSIGFGLLTYYTLMVFMQPIILALTCVGVGIIQFLVPYNPAGQVFCYVILGIILFIVSLVLILGPFWIMRLFGAVKKTVILVV